ncbi:MAG: hypothetical protein R8K47_06725, partial [Mariprofundaceae bacterium]
RPAMPIAAVNIHLLPVRERLLQRGNSELRSADRRRVAVFRREPKVSLDPIRPIQLLSLQRDINGDALFEQAFLKVRLTTGAPTAGLRTRQALRRGRITTGKSSAFSSPCECFQPPVRPASHVWLHSSGRKLLKSKIFFIVVFIVCNRSRILPGIVPEVSSIRCDAAHKWRESGMVRRTVSG